MNAMFIIGLVLGYVVLGSVVVNMFGKVAHSVGG